MAIILPKTAVITCGYCGNRKEIRTQKIIWIGKHLKERIFEYTCPVCGEKERIGERRIQEEEE